MKSLNLDIEELILKNFDNNYSKVIQYYSDIGVIKEEYNYEGDNIEEAVAELNKEANIGEEFKAVTHQDGTQQIVKVAKIESIIPLELAQKCDQIGKELKDDVTTDFTERELNSFRKLRHRLVDGEEIPDEMLELLGAQKGEIFDLA